MKCTGMEEVELLTLDRVIVERTGRIGMFFGAMRRFSIPLVILVALVSLTFFFGAEVCAQNGEVKFRGVAATTEKKGGLGECYGSYYCNVTVEEILYDPNNTLSLEDFVKICYNESLSLEIGDQVECYGYYWKSFGPYQYVGRIVCIGNDFYVRLRAPVGGIWIPVNKLELLAPYIGLTLLLAVAVITVGYVKKRKRDTEINS